MQPSSALDCAFTQLKSKQPRYQILYSYLRGDQPVQYATERLRSTFKDITARWSENWCSIVIESLLDRLQLKGFKLENEPAKLVLEELWDALDLSLDADDIARDVAVCGEAFLMVEKTDAGVRAFANAPHLCTAHYLEDNPRELEYAAKWFDSGGVAHLTLYYPDVLIHYVATKPRSEVTEAKAFTLDPAFPDGEEKNLYGRIPLFHFQRDRNSECGELQNVIPLQNALNKLFADMMVSAEYGAFPQRWAILHAGTKSELKSAPNTILEIPFDAESGQKPEVGQFAATQLKNFLDGIDHIAMKIAVLTRTPRHYLMQNGDMSGEALIAEEAPLSRKAQKYTHRLGVTWCQAVQFMLELSGHAVTENDIEPVWDDVRTVQPLTESQVRLNNAKAGIAIEVQLEDEGWTDEQLARIADAETQKTVRETEASDVARADALARFNAGQVKGAPNATVAE
jgi:hypothetical protein